MAALTVQQRTQIWRGLMRYWSAERETCAFTKYALYNPANNTGAIADIDNWIDTHGGNTTSDSDGANGALSTEMRSALTTAQKGFLMMCVVAARTGNVEILKRAVAAEVD